MNPPIKIMVVEDERIVAFNLQQRLSRLGYEVPAVAASGEEALRLADETDPDLVLMDIRIQGNMDGIEVASRLNATHPLPVIFLTAHSEDTTIERARQTHPYGYLLKPFSEREMHATILMALERRKVEVELGESEERLRLALDAAELGVWDLDTNTRDVTLSERSRDIFGLARNARVGFDNLLDCVDSDDRARIASEFENCLALLRPLRAEFRRAEVGNDRRWIRIEARARPAQRVIGVVQDISASKTVEAKLQQLNDNLESLVLEKTAELRQSLKELDTFSYSVAHDLGAPLRSISGYSQILLTEYGAQLDDTAQRYLRNIGAASNRMAQLIDGLLNLSRLTRGHLSRSDVDLAAMATNIERQLREADPGRKVDFIIAAGLTAHADRVLVRNLLDNLLRNAWKFTSRHATARIEIGAREIAGETVYFVSDDGAGFDMTHADRLFQPFHRLHRSDEFEGTGIGMATAHRIVERHGGAIWADAAPEKGATFYFTLTPKHH